MSTIIGPAREFFDACETGQGWAACQSFCQPGATFTAQADALAEIQSLEDYCNWMQGLMTPCPDGHYELKFFAANEDDTAVAGVGVFKGTHTGPDGPDR